jgi:diazepam-binding inhibitor (GABA receptor modulating acyl-CoA-binding protein)
MNYFSILKYFFYLNIYLEATVGDNNTNKPDMFDLRGKYKWNAWNTNKGKNKGTAQQEYIALVRQLQSKL